jgi:HAMP domain-containing protein
MLSLAQIIDWKSEGNYVLGVLNSKIVWYFLKSICVVRNGGYIEVKPQYFEQIPIPKFNSENEKCIIVAENSNTCSILTNDFYNHSANFIKLLYSKNNSLNINNKIEKWYELSYSDFIKELAKQKIHLTLNEQSEWLQFFEQEKTKLLTLKDEINRLEKEIDRMVYELYELTEEEIGLVEGL